MIRVFVSVYGDIRNFSKVDAFTALITGLEPILGVINACLPFVPLVVQRIGQTSLFQRLSTSLKRITKSPQSDSAQTADSLRVGKSGHYRGLPDIEMNPVKDSSFVTSFVSSRRQDEIPESQLWDGPNDQDRIFVHKDYSVRSELH